MRNRELQLISIWKLKYIENIKNRYITFEEALTMMSNEMFIDKKRLQTILK